MKSSSKRRHVISLESDEENEEFAEESIVNPVRRPASLTPPPVVGEEALRQAMAVINEHVHKNRPRTGKQTSPTATTEESNQPELIQQKKEEFDLAKYQAQMNSEIARQAVLARPKGDDSVETILLLLRGRKMDAEEVPEGWEKPLGMKVKSSTTFAKMKEEFASKKDFKGDVVLSFKGVRLFHGTPKDLAITNEECLGIHQSWSY
jgi:Ubiquitin-2 like Rad60 SUMO-like